MQPLCILRCYGENLPWNHLFLRLLCFMFLLMHQVRGVLGLTLLLFFELSLFGVLSRSNLLKNHTLLNFASTYSQTPTLSSTKSMRIGPKNITDVDFADDIALLSEDIRTATELLHMVEIRICRSQHRVNLMELWSVIESHDEYWFVQNFWFVLIRLDKWHNFLLLKKSRSNVERHNHTES